MPIPLGTGIARTRFFKGLSFVQTQFPSRHDDMKVRTERSPKVILTFFRNTYFPASNGSNPSRALPLSRQVQNTLC